MRREDHILAMVKTKDKVKKTLSAINQVIVGKKREIALALSCLLAGGHLLLEDLPGTGKTTLALVLSRVLGCSFARIQFTSDLLPSDILGGMIFHPQKGDFFFRPGPIFHQIILADEINRGTPKTQSALLEAMEERQVTIEGEIKPLPVPFFVIATQNPMELHGTFPLPESQLDRFLMRIHLGYPSFKEEIEIIKRGNTQTLIKFLSPILSPEEIVDIQSKIEDVKIREELIKYVATVVQKSREYRDFKYGLSTRALQGWVRVSKSYAFIHGRDYVIPEDLTGTFFPVAFHRIILKDIVDIEGKTHIINSFIEQFPIPQ